MSLFMQTPTTYLKSLDFRKIAYTFAVALYVRTLPFYKVAKFTPPFFLTFTLSNKLYYRDALCLYTKKTCNPFS